jgi:hypothetical protein
MGGAMRRAISLAGFLALIALLVGGCASRHREVPVMTLRPDAEDQMSKVAHSGVYRVEWLSEEKGGEPRKARSKPLYLKKGELLGFRAESNHEIVAIAGEYEVKATAPAVPAKAAWYRRPVQNGAIGSGGGWEGTEDSDGSTIDLSGFFNDPHEFHHHK